ncbi:S49 family peptidase [Psychroserpens burtonensis]|nr:S49 family peptidase [Psychroserpens burtonensis]
MVFSKTANEILRSPWFMEPKSALSFLPLVADILNKTQKDFDPRPEAVAVRSVITPQGVSLPREEEIPQGSIGVVSIMGPMLKYGDWCSYGSDDLVAFAKDFDTNENIIGQVWVMDSGGGSVAAVAPYLDFLKTKKKPVVSLSDMSASANYYIASSTDFIMAENNISSMFGSIGVMIEFADFKAVYEKEGIKVHTIYADESTHKNLAFKQALEGNYDAIKAEMLNPLAIKFQQHIRASRPNLKISEGVLNGKMFYAEEAQSIGLIDGIGNLDAAINYVKFLANASSFISTNY